MNHYYLKRENRLDYLKDKHMFLIQYSQIPEIADIQNQEIADISPDPYFSNNSVFWVYPDQQRN